MGQYDDAGTVAHPLRLRAHGVLPPTSPVSAAEPGIFISTGSAPLLIRLPIYKTY
jgi:hypothetical protein